MSYSYKCILSLLLPLIILATVTFAQRSSERALISKEKPRLQISFYRGHQFLDVARNGYKCKRCESMSSGFLIRMPLTKHVKLEGGLEYRSLLKQQASSNLKNNKLALLPNSSLNLPITIQYYPRSDKKRLQPFFGFGTSLNPFQQNNGQLLNDGDHYRSIPGTKYISILFMQGITFAINTKIDLTESLQFIPNHDGNMIGVSFGIGFRLP